MPSRNTQLQGKKIALVATDGFEEDELNEPKKALLQAGARVDVISVHPGEIRAWKRKDWSGTVPVDRTIDEVDSQDYDALVLPGGVINADRLRTENGVIDFVADFVESGKPIAAICHGPWALVETGGVKGRTMTSWPSLQTDLRNAGARWVDQEVVTDNGWVTSRMPADIPAFNKKMIEEFAAGIRPPSRQDRNVESQVQTGDFH